MIPNDSCVFCFLLVKVCHKKWKGLRDTYRNYKKKEKERRRSGAGAGGGKTWKFARIMAFIDPFMEDRPSESNMVEPGPSSESECECESEGAMTADQAAGSRAQAAGQSSQSGEQRTPQTGRGRGCSCSFEVEEKLITALEAVRNRQVATVQAPPEDSDSLFFRSLLEDFRTLSVRTRQDLKFEMHRMVYEAKCREDDQLTTS